MSFCLNVKPIKYDLAGSSHEKVEASPLVPAIRANTGVIQQSEAAIAVKSPAPINFFSVFMPNFIAVLFRYDRMLFKVIIDQIFIAKQAFRL